MKQGLRILVALLLLLVEASAAAQSASSATPETADRSFKLLREDEDWSFLADRANRQDFWDRLKYIRLRGANNDWFMTVSGEAREIWEQIGNDNWGQAPYWNAYLNERYMLGFDIHYGKHVRTFVELKSGLNSFRSGGPRPIDEKKLDFQAAFLQVGTGEGQNSIEVRAGRHQLEYGSGRLIDVREGPNVRLSFDGFLLKSKINQWRVDGFAIRPDEDKPGFFDNAPNHQVGFWGVYASRSLPKTTSLELYYLGLDRKDATFQRGTAQEVRHSLGGRASRPVATDQPGWDFDYEALWQFGTFGPDNIRAWTVASETGYRFPTIPLKPRFSAKADISSGDHPNSHTLGTFNPLFPKGNYFGVLATTGPGPINFVDLHPHIETDLPHDVSASFDWIFQWRECTHDGVYAVPGFLIRAADGSHARYVGHRPGTEIRWQATRHMWFQGDYGVFFAGRFLKETQPARNLNYWALWAGYKF
ncbi:MAG: alginate export family protein [Acidobacteriaceae bacterium]|nr:alginate export family protein [Acidobacteriaceae bacterium]